MDKKDSDGNRFCRERIQLCIDSVEGRVRRRVAGKLHAAGRGFFDVDDVLASTRRRVDQAAAKGSLRVGTPQELEAYVTRVAERVALETVRKEGRRRTLLQAHVEGVTRDEPMAHLEKVEDVRRAIGHLCRDNQNLLVLWSNGLNHERIAAVTGVSLAAQQSRWRRLLIRLKAIAEKLGS